jgi:hypothetical protein
VTVEIRDSAVHHAKTSSFVHLLDDQHHSNTAIAHVKNIFITSDDMFDTFYHVLNTFHVAAATAGALELCARTVCVMTL